MIKSLLIIYHLLLLFIYFQMFGPAIQSKIRVKEAGRRKFKKKKKISGGRAVQFKNKQMGPWARGGNQLDLYLINQARIDHFRIVTSCYCHSCLIIIIRKEVSKERKILKEILKSRF